jgi:hypothetical protein
MLIDCILPFLFVVSFFGVNTSTELFMPVHLFVREFEPIRLLGLQFLGKLLVGVPSERKGPKIFGLTVGRPRSISDDIKKGAISTPQLFFYSISERLFKFPLSDNLCATLFDVLLGGASPKQVFARLRVKFTMMFILLHLAFPMLTDT